MKKLFICGDSWMSPTTNHPETHFSEIFAKKTGFDLISYAHPGMSNGGIAVQLDTAIKNKADFILFGSTSFDRIEIPKDNDLEKNFAESFSVYDLLYSTPSALSTVQLGSNNDFNLVSDSLYSLINVPVSFRGKVVPRYEQKVKIIKDYISELYFPQWKMQIDRMMMYAVAHKLHLSNIPYIYLFDTIGVKSPSTSYNWAWLDPKNNIKNFEDSISGTTLIGDDPGYHTSYETQVELADILLAHYNKYF
jgi:hypothetical protein